MYQVKNITKALLTFDGDSIKDMQGKELTLKEVLTNQMGSYQGKGVSGDMLIKAYDLGLKVYAAKKDVEFDDEQIKFVKTVLDASPMYTAIVIGQVLRILENSKVEDVEPEAKPVPKEK